MIGHSGVAIGLVQVMHPTQGPPMATLKRGSGPQPSYFILWGVRSLVGRGEQAIDRDRIYQFRKVDWGVKRVYKARCECLQWVGPPSLHVLTAHEESHNLTS